MSNIKYQAITEALSEIKTNQLDEQFNINPFRKKPPSYDEISASLSKSASRATPLPNVEFEPDRSAIHDVLDKSSIFPVSNLSKVSIPGGLAAGAYSKDGKDLSMNPNFMKAMDARNNKLLPRAVREQSLTEDGHTDVPSSIRMCKTIMEDAHDILCALCNTDMDEEIDTWWTNKLAVSASTLNKLRDYYVHEVDHEEQPDEADMEIEEQRGSGSGPLLPFNTQLARRGAKVYNPIRDTGGPNQPRPRGAGPAIYNTPRRNLNPMRGFPKRKAAIQSGAALGGLGLAALGNEVKRGMQEEAIEENALTDFARGVGRRLMHRGGPGTKPSPSTMGQLQGIGGPYLQKPVQRFLYPRERGMPPAARRQASMRTEDLEENIDIDFTDVANKYGKYAIPAGAALGAHMLLGKKREPLRNAMLAGAAGVGAEAAKRYYKSKNPGATSPYLQPAKIPEFKPTGQG